MLLATLGALALESRLLAAAQTPPDAAAILQQQVEALGGEEALAAAGDVELRGRHESVRGVMSYRLLVRREPFAVREEFSLPEDGPEIDAPFRGQTTIWVTDLRHAWQQAGNATGEALAMGAALPLMQRAFAWHLLLRARDKRPEAGLGPSFAMPDAPFFHDDFAEAREAHTLVLHGPAHTNVNAWFDAQDGRWLGLQDGPYGDGTHRLRAGRWRTFGGLHLPTALLALDDDDGLGAAIFIDGVTTGLQHADRLFAGDPQPSGTSAAVRDVAPLSVERSVVPGTAYLLAGDISANGRGPLWALFDTGADRLVVVPSLAQSLQLPYLGPALFTVLAGKASATQHWLSQLTLGSERRLQLSVIAQDLPALPELNDVRPAGLVVGREVFDGDSPVLDLARGRLLLRGRPAQPLAEVGGGTPRHVALIPLSGDKPGSTSLFVDVSVGDRTVRALLDTGGPYLLRLSTAGLRKLGLPVGEAAWTSRGARPFALFGAGGASLPDMLVRLDAVVLHATDAAGGAPIEIVHEQPWVLVSTATSAASDPSSFEAIVGTAALLPFARIGIDDGRGLLELELGSPSPMLVSVRDAAAPAPAQAARWSVPPPGEYLGMVLGGRRDERDRPGNELPRVIEVDAGYAADAAGIRVGDSLKDVDGQACAGRPLTDIAPLLWPAPGQRLTLTLVRDGTGEFRVVLP